MAGAIPYAAAGAGPPVVVLAGLWPSTGVQSDALVRGAVSPLRGVATSRRLIVFNRRAGYQVGCSLRDMAAEYADAIRAELVPPVDVVGTSTGGSLAQQLAADHPDTVRRLVLLSTACRLGPAGRDVQRRIAELLRAGQLRAATRLIGTDLAPPVLRIVTGGLAWAAAGHLVPDAATAADLATTLEAEDAFDLAQLPTIRAKTLIIAGGRDRFYDQDLFRATAALIPASDLRIFPRRGHITVASDRRARAAIAGFLSYPSAPS